MNTAPFRDHAQWYAAHGWRVSPLKPLSKVPFANCDRCRRPTTERPNPAFEPHQAAECPCIKAGGWCHGFLASTVNPDIIAGWIERCPAANIAVAMGPSGLLVLDFDDHKGRAVPDEPLPGLQVAPEDAAALKTGADAFGLLCRLRGREWPRTLTWRTPTGHGHQQAFTVTDKQQFTPSAGALAWQTDVKAGSSYAIAPGSRTRDGKYEAVIGMDPQPLDDWIADELVRTGHFRQAAPVPNTERNPPAISGGRGYVRAVVLAELDSVANAAPGTRHVQICKSATALGGFVGAGLLDRTTVIDALMSAAQDAGVPAGERKALQTIETGVDFGARRPRTIPTRGRTAR